jgi:PAS domain S-box-containing protein
MKGITVFALGFASYLASWQSQSARAQTSAPEGRRIIHEFWTFKEGAPEVVESLAQTADGYLWLGAESGLFRFDGVRFERFQSPFGDQLPGTDISSLFAPRTGGLWIGYRFASGFSFLKNGKLTNFRFPSPTGTVNGFAQDDHGVMWAATTRGVWRFDGSSWRQNPYEWEPQFGPVAQVGFDRENRLWGLTERKGAEYGSDLFFLEPGGAKFQKAGSNLFVIGFTRDADRTVLTTHEKRNSAPGSGLELKDSLPSYPILRRNSEQLVDRDNGIWVASIEDPLFRHRAGEPFAESISRASLKYSQSLGFDPYRYSGMVDREGSVWYGAVRGLHRFGYSSLMQLSLPEGHHWVALAPDEGGKVWISTGNANGNSILYHVADGKVESEKPQHGVANFAYRAPDKTYWFAGEGGLWHMAGGRLTRIELPPALTHRDNDLQATTQDRSGGMWVSFWNRGLYRFDHGSWTQYGGRRDLPIPRVHIEFTDSLGRIWFGSRNNVLAVLEGDRVRTFGPGDGIQVGDIAAIYGRGSEIWIGGEFGLQQFDHGRFHSINALDKESLRGISGVVETANGDLWVNGQGGIFHVRHSEIAEALRNRAYRVSGERFGRGEGLPGLAPQYRPLPSAIEGTDGRLWFTVNNGVVWLDPAHASNKVAAPPVTIESVSADDKSYPMDSALRLPALTSTVQISYAALSLSDPEAIRFRYKLQETDKDWHDAGTTNSVSYRNLSPGSYHFVVDASDTNGVWEKNTATAEFTVIPAFYQTTWFRALMAAAFVALLWTAYKYRMWQVQREATQLRDVIETIPAYVWSALPDGSVDFTNQRLLQFIGFSGDQARGWGWADALHPEDRGPLIDTWRASIASGKPVEAEARMRSADGQYRWLLFLSVPQRDHSGKIVKWYGKSMDIEDRKRAEQERERLRQLEADLAHTNRVSMMGELAASVAHEVNQPLTGIVSNGSACLRFLAGDAPNLQEAREAVSDIVRDGKRAGDVIARIRALTKRAALPREKLDLNETIREVLAIVGDEARKRSVVIRTQFTDDLWPVFGDRVQLQQVLLNLVINAMDSMNTVEKRQLVITTRNIDQEGVQVTVEDSGTGLDPKMMARIFEPFFTTKSSGMGMGLSISRSIVQNHGGRLWATANDGPGTSFHFTLPREREDPNARIAAV